MSEENKVFITHRAAICSECGEDLGKDAWIVLQGDQGALCLSCADLDHLVYLPSGNAALTRRAGKYATLSAVVLRWSRARNRYERQGLLVEEAALQQAEEECMADADVRAARQIREALRREDLDQQYIQQFAGQIREIYPACPQGVEQTIAEHACQKYSGRVGRSAAAKSLDEEAVRLAVIAHIRHTQTDYDQYLAEGADRHEARRKIATQVDIVLQSWREDE